MCYFEYHLFSVLYDHMTSEPFETIMINMLFENQRKMQQVTAFLINLNIKFERSCFVLTSHNTSMCSVVLTLHQLKIGKLRNKNKYFHEILNINSTDNALYEIYMLLNRYAYLIR